MYDALYHGRREENAYRESRPGEVVGYIVRDKKKATQSCLTCASYEVQQGALHLYD